MSEHHDHCDHDPIECSYDALVGEYQEAVAERDRLRVVVDMAREFDAADTAWHDKIARGENVRSTDDESRRRAGAILALLDAVRQLDGSAEATDE